MSANAPMLTNLASRYYVDPALFEAERQNIFRRTWQMIGPASALSAPGDYRTMDVAGWKLMVVMGQDGVLRAFHNVCRHRGARVLEQESGQCKALKCPYHNWVYDLEGTLKTAPWFGEDPGFNQAEWPLMPAQLAQWRGLLFIAIDPATDLITQLGDLPSEIDEFPIERYTRVHSHRFEARTNWKTYTDNFLEGYHIPGIHPSFLAVVDFPKFETVALNGMIRMSAPQKNGSIYGGKWLWMWSNWTLSTFPGGMNTSRINPISPDRTEILYDFYFADTSPAMQAERERTINTTLDIVREDFGVCEFTQQNYTSGAYSPGPLSPRHEQAVAYFQRRVVESIGL